MIELSFKISDESIFDVEAPERESPATVEHGMFECPVFFAVDGVSVLRHLTMKTASLPLVGFGPRALQRLRLLQAGAMDQITISDSGWMYFREQDGLVRIWTSSCPQGVAIPHGEALSAFERFVDEIKDLLQTRVPAMRDHPQWGYWFPD